MILGMGIYSTGASSKRQLRPAADAVLAITGKEINPQKVSGNQVPSSKSHFVVRRRKIGHGLDRFKGVNIFDSILLSR
jgi:hypothetical protein